jgi:Ca2+-binding RTX toxin-like protein
MSIEFFIFFPIALIFSFLLDIGGQDDDAGDNRGMHMDGSSGDDSLVGGEANDSITAGAGDDTVLGMGGDDGIWAGEGDDGAYPDIDNMTDEELSDLIFGGDTAALQEFVTASTGFGADGGAGNDYVDGGPGDDVVTGGTGNDVVRGSSGHDLLVDLEGANTLNGGFGDDELWALDHEGANAADLLQGWEGDDDLLGDDGDTMEGGDGVDSFYSVWQPGDAAVTITDFDPATESLFINTSDLPASPLLQLVDLGDGSGCEVQLNGETLAVLQGVSAAEVLYGNGGQNELWLLDRVGGQYYQPVLANMALAS